MCVCAEYLVQSLWKWRIVPLSINDSAMASAVLADQCSFTVFEFINCIRVWTSVGICVQFVHRIGNAHSVRNWIWYVFSIYPTAAAPLEVEEKKEKNHQRSPCIQLCCNNEVNATQRARIDWQWLERKIISLDKTECVCVFRSESPLACVHHRVDAEICWN